MSTRALAPLTLLALLTPLAPACGDSEAGTAFEPSGSGPEVQEDGPRKPLGTSLFLEVMDPAGKPIPRARVTLPLPDVPEGSTGLVAFRTEGHLIQPVARHAGKVEYRTDGAGQLLLEELEQIAGDRLVARVEAPGYAPASVVLEGLSPGARMGARAVLVPVAASFPVDVAQGATVEHEGVRVQIPAGGVVDAGGAPVAGIVELQLVPFESTSRLHEQPGPLEAAREDGSPASLETLAMAEISLWQDGRPLQLAPGARATIELPLPEAWTAHPDPARRPKPGDAIPAWWFDLDAGVWREEGAGAVVPATGRPGELAWSAEVAHFTWWNCDEPWTNHSCILVTVHKDGVPLQGVTIYAVGFDYQGESQPKVTDAQGQACVAIMKGGEATIYVGDKQNPLVPPFNVEGEDQAAACDGNGDACKGVNIDLGGGDKFECDPGDSYTCEYSGPEGEEGVGICKAGTNFCGVDHKWKGCQGEVGPGVEQPDTPEDEDCNGDAHNGMSGCDKLGEQVPCYDGPGGTMDVGICKPGVKTCVLDPNDPQNLLWSACAGQTLPDLQTDECQDPDVDSDCDGEPSCGYAAWEQHAGDAAAQYIAAVAVTDDGTAHVLGRYLGTIQFGNFQLVNNGAEPRTFLASFLPDGTPAGQPKDLGEALAGELEIAARGMNGLYVAGTLTGHFTDGNCDVQSSDGKDGLVLRYEGGLCLEALPLGDAAGPQVPSGLAVYDDRLYVVGAFGGSITVDGQTISTAVNEDEAFLLALDPADIDHAFFVQDLMTAWGAHLPGRPAVAADDVGLALVTAFSGQVTVGNVIHTSGMFGSPLLVRVDKQGTPLWARVLGDDPPGGMGVGIDDATKEIAVAYAAGTELRVSQWLGDVAPQWEVVEPQTTIASPELGGARLAVNKHGAVIVHAGFLGGNARDGRILKWTEAGAHVWDHVYGDINDVGATDGLGVAIAPDQRIVIVGRHEADFILPDNVVVAIDEPGDAGDGFVARLDP